MRRHSAAAYSLFISFFLFQVCLEEEEEKKTHRQKERERKRGNRSAH